VWATTLCDEVDGPTEREIDPRISRRRPRIVCSVRRGGRPAVRYPHSAGSPRRGDVLLLARAALGETQESSVSLGVVRLSGSGRFHAAAQERAIGLAALYVGLCFLFLPFHRTVLHFLLLRWKRLVLCSTWLSRHDGENGRREDQSFGAFHQSTPVNVFARLQSMPL
jgi:hypothetical protein